MAKKTTTPAKTAQVKTVRTSGGPLFTRENYIWMLGGAIVMLLGVILMAGGKSDDPNVFNKDEVYSTTRITIAPILIILGLVIEVFAIFRKPRG